MSGVFLFPVSLFSSLIFIPSLMLSFAISSSVIPFSYAFLHNGLVLFLAIWVFFFILCRATTLHSCCATFFLLFLPLNTSKQSQPNYRLFSPSSGFLCSFLHFSIPTISPHCFPAGFHFLSSYFHPISPILFFSFLRYLRFSFLSLL